MTPLSQLISILALALMASAQEMLSAPTCTSTVTHPPGCCPKLAAHTTTSYTSCGSCALDIVTQGPMCMVFCGTTTPVDPSRTTTITECFPKPSPSLITSYVSASSTNSTIPIESSCTSSVIELVPFPCGDCGVGTVDVTSTVDCQGHALATVAEDGMVGICVCPTAPPTRIVSVCAVDATALV